MIPATNRSRPRRWLLMKWTCLGKNMSKKAMNKNMCCFSTFIHIADIFSGTRRSLNIRPEVLNPCSVAARRGNIIMLVNIYSTFPSTRVDNVFYIFTNAVKIIQIIWSFNTGTIDVKTPRRGHGAIGACRRPIQRVPDNK